MRRLTRVDIYTYSYVYIYKYVAEDFGAIRRRRCVLRAAGGGWGIRLIVRTSVTSAGYVDHEKIRPRHARETAVASNVRVFRRYVFRRIISV